MMLPALALAAVVGAAQQPVILTLAQAKAMTTAQLAHSLLPGGHPPIVESRVHPFGMESPAPVLTGVDLMAQAGRADAPGFCAATVYSVAFEQTAPYTPGAKPVAARAGRISSETLYRLPSGGRRPARSSCASRQSGFFRVAPDSKVQTLTVMRLLAAAQAVARKHHRLPFITTFTDQTPDAPQRITPVAALRMLPLSESSDIDLAPSEGYFSLAKWIVDSDGQRRSIAQVNAGGGAWVVDIVYRSARIARLNLIRRVPPPF